ncbi:hypothetical protein FSP39_010661 [Pinctada imbricata]|uniref:BPTI/Kunitz inhibitor domain-containing protein n=1 Tax=Pinctada imbricata TaxID=66713 RepID=A0AA89BKB7_PINIB|nr:hypothetical protein FSP39_010661 [Pinctada imbricata]
MQAEDADSSWAPGLTPISGVWFLYVVAFCLFDLIPVLSIFCMPSICDFPNCRLECLEPKAPGYCRGYFPSYYYDPWAGKCKKFIYGGCMGNRNRFLTKKQCYRRCKKEIGH